MAQLSVDRKQRLRTLESNIRKLAEQIQKNGLEIGRELIEIREEELWKGSHESWSQYLKEMAEDLVGKTFGWSQALIQAAEIQKRIPQSISHDVMTNLNASHLHELGRLAPVVGKSGERGAEKDYSRIRTPDIARVLKRATEIAKEESPSKETPSVRDVRKAVDIELGIDRTKKSEPVEEDNGIDLPVYLRQKIGQIEGIIELLSDVPADGWKQLDKSDPQLAKRLATACDQLAELLRS